MKIVHDIHTHNIFSSCCSDYSASTDAMLRKEAELGMKIFGLSYHIWDERVKGESYWYRNQSLAKGEEAKNAFARTYGIQVLLGAETEYYACKDRLGMSCEGAAHLDYLLVPHTHLHMRNEVMADYPEVREMRESIRKKLKKEFPYLSDNQISGMANTLKEADLFPFIEEWQTDIRKYTVTAMTESFDALMANSVFRKLAGRLPVSVAHCFSPCGVPHPLKNSYLELLDDGVLANCFREAAHLHVSVEINIGAVKEVEADLSRNQMMRIFRRAKEAGCKCTFGTDAHSVAGLEEIRFADQIAEFLGLTAEDIADFLKDGIL